MRMSGRYPWGEATLYLDALAFWAKVKKYEQNGVVEDVIVEAINETLPTECKMSMREFRAARSKAIRELRFNQRCAGIRASGLRKAVKKDAT